MPGLKKPARPTTARPPRARHDHPRAHRRAGPDESLEHGRVLEVGTLRFETRFTPGHTPGHVVFYVESEKAVFDGDVLFQGSIGRADFPGGDFDTLIASIRDQLLTLPDDVVVYSGHGPPTTIGHQRPFNPFLLTLK